jgi:hypothetical protein
MRLVIRNIVALLLLSFVAKIAIQAGPDERVDTKKIPKSLLLGTIAKNEMLPSGHINTGHLVKTLNKAALQKGL